MSVECSVSNLRSFSVVSLTAYCVVCKFVVTTPTDDYESVVKFVCCCHSKFC